MATANPLLDLDPGIGEIRAMWRFRVLDRGLELIGTVKPLAATGISAAVGGSIKRRINGVIFNETDLRDLNLYQDRIQPVYALEDGTEWACGVYLFTDAAKNVGTYTSTMAVTLMDQDYLLDQVTQESFGLPNAGSIVPAVHVLLDQANIVHRIVPESATATVADPVNWPAGTSRLKIITDLSKLAGWLPPYFDNRGVFVLRQPPDIDRVIPDHTYAPNRVAYSTMITDENLLTAPNVYTVIGSGPSQGEIVASAEVDAALSYSVQNRGYKIISISRPQGLTSTEQAQQMANAQAAAGAGYRGVRFTGPPDPRHDLFDTVDFLGTTYRETGWELGFAPGAAHSHTITLGGFIRVG